MGRNGKEEQTMVKLCSLRRPADAEAANAAKPDLAGFILSPGFRRSIPVSRAEELRRILSPSIRTVGVFVDAQPEEILSAARSGCLDMIQLHGEEGEALIREVAVSTGLPVIKAYRIGSRLDLERAASSAAQWVLLDSGPGTGKSFDWDMLAAGLEDGIFPGGHPWILAGGLSPENVEEVVRRFHPTAVDVSSRVETDGRKDPEKMKAFTAAARRGAADPSLQDAHGCAAEGADMSLNSKTGQPVSGAKTLTCL